MQGLRPRAVVQFDLPLCWPCFPPLCQSLETGLLTFLDTLWCLPQGVTNMIRKDHRIWSTDSHLLCMAQHLHEALIPFSYPLTLRQTQTEKKEKKKRGLGAWGGRPLWPAPGPAVVATKVLSCLPFILLCFPLVLWVDWMDIDYVDACTSYCWLFRFIYLAIIKKRKQRWK